MPSSRSSQLPHRASVTGIAAAISGARTAITVRSCSLILWDAGKKADTRPTTSNNIAKADGAKSTKANNAVADLQQSPYSLTGTVFSAPHASQLGSVFHPRGSGFHRGRRWGADTMSSISFAGTSCVSNKANRIDPSAPSVLAARIRNVMRLSALALAAAVLAACAQTSVVSKNSEWLASRQASLDHNRNTAFVTNTRVAVAKKHTPFAHAAGTRLASGGLASFYSEGTHTASGEKFDAQELTAAHPTLPFGTRLRVTNVATGRSVTVRVNDRGPFVPGRVVDVSYAAAESLGMVGRGVAKVKLDVVQ
jgi:rare lipoprotein A